MPDLSLAYRIAVLTVTVVTLLQIASPHEIMANRQQAIVFLYKVNNYGSILGSEQEL